ncbi:transglutaminase domain-containing protein [Mucilaginibacter ginsenosidivorax]|uniref:Transglutaminase-like domain-containing protein n=1 Tax=Mucilaginibacter ginsenosidivorax TaxID=862126 RepID=A0A5B8WCK3_9SPHI|nr:transglutaminase domain-containing protein [Mucilaginibacter ginsenosidivorax]QEC80282.1 hypothetical protein FSB76_31600 [Mucilaginibacter ginsenosidivorax]
MKLNFCVLFFLASAFFKPAFSQTANTDSADLEYVKNIGITTTSFEKLLPAITKPGITAEQKLKLVYYWVYAHIDFDTQRFRESGPLQPLSTQETLKSGRALCYEYNGFVDIACSYLKIPGFDIEGYVKYYGFEPGDSFTQNNHIWHAVYINGKWKMIDFLWGSGSLTIKGDDYKFKKGLHPSYFLALPDDFLKTHLPADPVFQFQEKPLTMAGFTAKDYNEIDNEKRGNYINYADSIKASYKLPVADNEIKSALRAYKFNPNNADQLIIVYYNAAVKLMNNDKASKDELTKAKSYFLQDIPLIEKTPTKELKPLLQVCNRGVASASLRLKKFKS